MALKKLGFEKKYPDWQVRKFRMLLKVFGSRDFIKTVHRMMTEASEDEDPKKLITDLLNRFSLPIGCYWAMEAYIIYAYIPTEVMSAEDFIKEIEPEPISYVNISQKAGGVNGTGSQSKNRYKELVEASGGDILKTLAQMTLLAIPAYTTRDEINQFLDKNYSSNLKPLLTGGKSARVANLSSLELGVVRLREKGLSYKEIEKVLSESKTYSEEHLRKIYSRHKKRFS